MDEKEKLNKCCGNVALITSILGFILVLIPYIGIILSIIAVTVGTQQNKIKSTQNSRIGKLVGIIGIIINALMLITIFVIPK